MRAAIVDIGSNSIRLVLYACHGAHAQPVFNEKAACALGTGLTRTGHLHPPAKEAARATIQSFATILQHVQPDFVRALATAALREARDGPAFRQALEAMLGYPIALLSSQDEATLAAQGVKATRQRAEGLVVDLGGGSIDMAHLHADGSVTPAGWTSFGALAMAEEADRRAEGDFIRWLHRSLALPEQPPVAQLHAVGGSFRALACHHMRRQAYPLAIIHDYSLSRAALADGAEAIAADRRAGVPLKGMKKSRAASLYPAAQLLLALMERYQADEVVFSSAGIREGALQPWLHETAPAPEIANDPLLAMLSAIPRLPPAPGYPEALAAWLTAILPCQPEEARFVPAFCEISDIAAAVHPDYRADYAFERLLSTLGYGMSHAEQVMLALAAYHRYSAKRKITHPALALLEARQATLAYALGQLAALAYRLSAGSASLLARYTLSLDADGAITVKVRGSSEAIAWPQSAKRREGLGEAISALASRA